MTASSELAALFEARRQKELAADGHVDAPANGTSNSSNSTGEVKKPPPASPGRSLTSPSPFRTSPPSTPNAAVASSLHNNSINSSSSSQHGASTTTSKQQQATPPTRSATPTRSLELTAKMEAANLEAGIPTPSFLAEMRKNLKPRNAAANTKITTGLTDVAVKSSKVTDGNMVGGTIGGNAVVVRENSGGAVSNYNSNTIDAPLDEQKSNHVVHSTTSSSSAGGGGGHVRTNNDLSARRSRLVAGKGNSATGDASSSHHHHQSGNGGSNRRERILAKVLANGNSNNHNLQSIQSSTSHNIGSSKQQRPVSNNKQPQQQHSASSIDTETSSQLSFDANKIHVTSPRGDEVEMLFADDDYMEMVTEQQEQQRLARNESIDSIFNELNQETNPNSISNSSSATIPIKNTQQQQQHHDSSSNASVATANNNNAEPNASLVNTTPVKSLSQQQRLHMASTPKIRGNCQYRRDNFDGQQQQKKNFGDGGQQQQGEDGSISFEQPPQLNYQSSPRQQKYQMHPDDEKSHNIHNAYSLNERAPSSLSAISGISIPSCFPQDSTFGHVQQPMLGGGGFGGGGGGTSIKETTSFGNSSATSGLGGGGLNTSSATPRGSGNNNAAGSAFSPAMHSENRRLREQLIAMQKKLEEKDGIISQLMKRIGDLESSGGSHSVPATPRSASGINTSYAMEPDSHALNSLWDRSRPASEMMYSQFPQRTPSADTESAMSSSSPHHGSTIHNPVAKQSPNTTATASTASVTTTNSSKSSRYQRLVKSASTSAASSSMSMKKKRSPRRRANQGPTSPNSSAGDDRKFQC
eukprot:g3710.t1 g3710   contig12:2624319-2626748(-)